MDASPLIGLARVDGLSWLRKLYRTISITKAVRAEATGARELSGAVALCAALKHGWIRVLRREWSEPPLPQLDADEAPWSDRLPGGVLILRSTAGSTSVAPSVRNTVLVDAGAMVAILSREIGVRVSVL